MCLVFEVSIKNVMELFRILKTRFPRRLLPQLVCCGFKMELRPNLRSLLDIRKDSRNLQRDFWRWLARQPWRQMLPQPLECHRLRLIDITFSNACIACAVRMFCRQGQGPAA